jgi:hypothetical protein
VSVENPYGEPFHDEVLACVAEGLGRALARPDIAVRLSACAAVDAMVANSFMTPVGSSKSPRFAEAILRTCVPPLVELLNTPLRQRASGTLECFVWCANGQLPDGPPFEELKTVILRLLASADPVERHRAVSMLADLRPDDPAVWRIIERAASSDEDEEVRQLAEFLVERRSGGSAAG